MYLVWFVRCRIGAAMGICLVYSCTLYRIRAKMGMYQTFLCTVEQIAEHMETFRPFVRTIREKMEGTATRPELRAPLTN